MGGHTVRAAGCAAGRSRRSIGAQRQAARIAGRGCALAAGEHSSSASALVAGAMDASVLPSDLDALRVRLRHALADAAGARTRSPEEGAR
jgi:hypothetical protein